MVHGDEYVLHAGDNWSHQYSAHNEIYFSTKNDYEASDRAKDVLKDFFEAIDNEELKHTACPIAFEFIVKGCRKPWNVIKIERED